MQYISNYAKDCFTPGIDVSSKSFMTVWDKMAQKKQPTKIELAIASLKGSGECFGKTVTGTAMYTLLKVSSALAGVGKTVACAAGIIIFPISIAISPTLTCKQFFRLGIINPSKEVLSPITSSVLEKTLNVEKKVIGEEEEQYVCPGRLTAFKLFPATILATFEIPVRTAEYAIRKTVKLLSGVVAGGAKTIGYLAGTVAFPIFKSFYPVTSNRHNRGFEDESQESVTSNRHNRGFEDESPESVTSNRHNREFEDKSPEL